MFYFSCTKVETKYITNTIIQKDSFIEIFYPCDSFYKWKNVNGYEANKIFDIYINDTLDYNYEFSSAYYGVKGTFSYHELPYYNIVKNYSVRYILHSKTHFILVAYGDTINMDYNSDNMYGGSTLVFRKKWNLAIELPEQQWYAKQLYSYRKK